MPSAEFKIRFLALQKRFLQRIQTELPEMPRMLEVLRSHHGFQQLNAFQSLVHQYSGNGRTFGFPEISDAAVRLEKELQQVDHRQSLLSCMSKIELLTQALQDVLTDAAGKGDFSLP